MVDWRNVVKKTQMWKYQQGLSAQGVEGTVNYQLYRTKRGNRFKMGKRIGGNNSKLYWNLRHLCHKRRSPHIPEQQAPFTMVESKEQFYLTCVSDFHLYFLHQKWNSSHTQVYIADMSTSELIWGAQKATGLSCFWSDEWTPLMILVRSSVTTAANLSPIQLWTFPP